MNPFDPGPANQKKPVDYTGLKIGGILAPVYLLFIFLGKDDLGFTVCIVLGCAMVAIWIRWKLRRHLWFWATVGFILALHVPLFPLVRPPHGNVPTLFYVMPLGIMDFLVILGALGLAERVFSRNAPSDDEGE